MCSDGGQSGLQQERGVIKVESMSEHHARKHKSLIIYGLRAAMS